MAPSLLQALFALKPVNKFYFSLILRKDVGDFKFAIFVLVDENKQQIKPTANYLITSLEGLR